MLALLFGQPERSFQSAEVIGLAGSNRDSPVLPEPHGLVVKTMGLAGPLQEALAPFRDRIQAAFVYGSIAKGTDTTQSDVDLMVLCEDLTYSDLYDALQEAEAVLRRPVHVSLMTQAEWKRKLAADNPFVTKVQAQPTIPPDRIGGCFSDGVWKASPGRGAGIEAWGFSPRKGF